LSLLDKNIKFLRGRGVPIHIDLSETPSFVEESVKLLISANGLYTLQMEREEGGRILLHSAYDPLREAVNFVDGLGLREGARVILFGLGLGYHLTEVLRRVGKRGRVVAVEANDRVLRKALEVVDFSDLYSGGNFELIAGSEEGEIITGLKRLLDGELKDVPYNQLNLVIHSPSLAALPKHLRGIRDYLEGVVVARRTCQAFEDLTLNNIESNLPYVLDGHPVELLFGKFRDISTFLVGAGPSLGRRQIEKLKEAKNRALIVAVGTALKPLLRCGLEPDLVVATDPKKESYRHFEGVEFGGSPLIFLPTVCPDILRSYKGRKVVAFQEGYPEVDRIARSLSRTMVKTGGSVLTTALEVAIRMGGDPIALAGCDLGYPGIKGHVSGTAWDERWEERVSSSRFNTLETENRKYVAGGERAWVKGVDGGEVPTHLNLRSYLVWMEGRMRDEPRRFINVSHGAYIYGSELMEMEEAVERYCSGEPVDMGGYIAGLLRNANVSLPGLY
jgi:hypothetical protein